ncbi:MAG: hypothetical protein AAF573_18410 [Bacteroidota bacterium]
MKKKFLTMMLFFAFLMIGAQSLNAQYVSESEAILLLTNEVQTIEANPIYSGQQIEHPTYDYLVAKHDLYALVYEGIVVGGTVSNSITNGLNETESVDRDALLINGNVDDGGVTLSPIHQEIEDLLSL